MPPPDADPAADVRLLRSALEAAADPDKAAPMAAYMKDQFPFLGITSADRRRIAKPFLRAAKGRDPDHVLSLAEACWDEPEREFHYVGTDLLRAAAPSLRPSDLPSVRALVQRASWWDTVDMLAAHTVGTMVRTHPTLVAEMDRWIEDHDLWVARAAMLHQLNAKEATDAERLFRHVRLQMDHTDFFMRKAIGWALRQYARIDPDAVRAFVDAHTEELSGLSRREAMKHLR